MTGQTSPFPATDPPCATEILHRDARGGKIASYVAVDRHRPSWLNRLIGDGPGCTRVLGQGIAREEACSRRPLRRLGQPEPPRPWPDYLAVAERGRNLARTFFKTTGPQDGARTPGHDEPTPGVQGCRGGGHHRPPRPGRCQVSTWTRSARSANPGHRDARHARSELAGLLIPAPGTAPGYPGHWRIWPTD